MDGITHVLGIWVQASEGVKVAKIYTGQGELGLAAGSVRPGRP